VTQTHPRSNFPAAVAAQYLAPISSCVSDGCGHTGQTTAAEFVSGVVFASVRT
jgi:hypothetical protein